MTEIKIGTTVLYKLHIDDADSINKRREDFQKHLKKYPSNEDTGYIAHFGNGVREGDVFPAIIVRAFETSANLHVLLDGNDTFWATSVSEGEGFRQWTALS